MAGGWIRQVFLYRVVYLLDNSSWQEVVVFSDSVRNTQGVEVPLSREKTSRVGPCIKILRTFLRVGEL
jgi:hypothetical protein